MRSLKALAIAAAFVVVGVFNAALAESENTMIITLKDGEVVINLREDLAPQHVARIKELVRAGDYDNVAFHRVIPGFMAQTGDVEFGDMEDASFNIRRAGTGGSDKADLPAEFSDARYLRGVVGMARAQNPNSANSQFFIMFDAGEFLNGQYTVVGEVASGMEFVDNIKKGSQANNGAVSDPDRMIKVEIAADR
ncbi:MAG: peptidylprolyl isomerase [Pseudomonadota bacterium]